MRSMNTGFIRPFSEEEIYPKDILKFDVVGKNNDIYTVKVTRDPEMVTCTCKGFQVYKYCDHIKKNKNRIHSFLYPHKKYSKDVTDTSIEAYYDLFNEDEITNRQIEYLKALHKIKHAATDLEVSRFAGHSDPNYFRPRRYELAGYDSRYLMFKAHPLVKQIDTRPCKVSHRRAKIWKLTDLGKKIVEKIILLEGNGGPLDEKKGE